MPHYLFGRITFFHSICLGKYDSRMNFRACLIFLIAAPLFSLIIAALEIQSSEYPESRRFGDRARVTVKSA
jgi:hypothetical protein